MAISLLARWASFILDSKFKVSSRFNITFNFFISYSLLAIHLVGNLDVLQAATSPCQMLKMTFFAYLPRLFFFLESNWEYSKLFPLREKLYTLFTETGYIHLQATKPDTIASSLIDSPVGLAAYILDKFASLGNSDNVNRRDGGLVEKFDLDELITNVMLYWHSSAGVAASLRFWRENFVESTDLLRNILRYLQTMFTFSSLFFCNLQS